MNNLWDAATTYVEFSVSGGEATEIVFTPSGGDGHVYLNGFEIDGPAIDLQAGFPSPENHNEHVQLEETGTIQASWRAVAGAKDAKYNVYLGTSAADLKSVGQGLQETSVVFKGE